MKKDAETVCLHDLGCLSCDLQKHLVQLQVKAYQLAELKQGVQLFLVPKPALARTFSCTLPKMH